MSSNKPQACDVCGACPSKIIAVVSFLGPDYWGLCPSCSSSLKDWAASRRHGGGM